ncbi:MAG: trimethylamine methyltransferase family protein [Deltaproteobacteria bacterium]|jgi:trimethylamine--corrinoid protein Co-methyltransferase|nr:trimethylamine methyltransferase family protein [Deltaproteobacteria bacterium]
MSFGTDRQIGLSVLGPEKIVKIHEAALYLLTKSGSRVGGQRALDLLAKNGATIDGDLVKVTESMVEKAIETVPKSLKLYKRDGSPYLEITPGGNQVFYGTHSDQLEILDPFTGQARPFLRADNKLMCQLASYLENISFVLSVGMSSDVKPEIQTQITLLDTLRNFDKVTNFSTNDVSSLYDCIEIASIVAGGLKNLQEKPFVFNYCEPIPPRTHPVESTEKLWISAENRIPVVYMPYSMMGGTSPMSMPASLAQGHAEFLLGLVLTQLVSPGAPVIYGHMPSILDMKTTVGSYGAYEFHLLVAAGAELSSYLGIPFYGTAGCSDAKFLDEQAVTELTMEVMSTTLSKANLIHDIGVLDHCNSVAPEAVVLCNDLIEGFKVFARGVGEVNDETLALPLIEKTGPGGTYVTTPHTAKRFKTVFYSSLFSRKMKNPDRSEVREKILATINKAVNDHQVPSLDKPILTELEKWEKKLLG